MYIYPGIRICGLSLFVESESILIISDTQIGYEENLREKGVMVPGYQYNDLKKAMTNLLKKLKPSKVIINGDIKHEFGRISKTEWRQTLDLIDTIKEKSSLILIQGNHDTVLEPILKKRDMGLVDHYKLDNIFICHGHRIPDSQEFKRSKIVIIGHEHPAITLKEKNRKEKYKCFLKGRYKDKTLIVLPSFNTVTDGTDILREKLLSPFLADISDFEVYVSAGTTMYLGKTKDLL